MSLSIDEIEAEVLKLPEEARTELIERLMTGFQKTQGWDDQIARTWAEEAERRSREMTETGDEGVPAEEVFRRLRSRPR
jgi:putative addiction module component (TIGR02574 family)